MTNRNVMILGLVLVGGGLLLLAGSLFGFDAWAFFWPMVLIALGVWFILRPAAKPSGAPVTFHFLGDVRRSGAWTVANEEFSQFVGDVNLDCSQALIQPGETRLVFSGFVGDVTVVVPPGVGVMVTSMAFVSEIKLFGQHREAIFSPSEMATPDYAAAEKRLKISTQFFVADVTVRN